MGRSYVVFRPFFEGPNVILLLIGSVWLVAWESSLVCFVFRRVQWSPFLPPVQTYSMYKISKLMICHPIHVFSQLHIIWIEKTASNQQSQTFRHLSPTNSRSVTYIKITIQRHEIYLITIKRITVSPKNTLLMISALKFLSLA